MEQQARKSEHNKIFIKVLSDSQKIGPIQVTDTTVEFRFWTSFVSGGERIVIPVTEGMDIEAEVVKVCQAKLVQEQNSLVDDLATLQTQLLVKKEALDKSARLAKYSKWLTAQAKNGGQKPSILLLH